jgi:transcriptional regulator with GAF, ATPase, and Fis domain/tetratricopeptide (TPR) repeat protein
LVSGPSGIGKKRVVAEFRRRVQVAGAVTLSASFGEDSGLPFAGFGSIVRQAVALVGEKSEEVARYRSDLALVMPSLMDSSPVAPLSDARATSYPSEAVPGPEEKNVKAVQNSAKLARAVRSEPATTLGPPVPFGRMRMRLVNRIVSFIIDLAARRPLVIFLYDSHLMNPVESEMFSFLARKVKAVPGNGGSPRPPIIMVATYLADASQERMARTQIDRLVGDGDVAEHRLGALSETETGQLLSSMFQLKYVPRELLATIFRGSGGIPFLIEEMANSLLEEGAITFAGGEWTCDLGKLPQVPGQLALADLVLQRIERFTPQETQLAETLATFSVPADSSVVLKAAELAVDGSNRAPTATTLDALVEKGLAKFSSDDVREQGGGLRQEADRKVSFAHRRLKELLYARLTSSRRSQLHDSVALALLEKLTGVLDVPTEVSAAVVVSSPESIGLHLLKGSNPARALPLLLREAEQCTRSFANERALELYQAALALTQGGSNERRMAILSAIGSVQTLLCKYEEAIRSHGAAMRFVRCVRDSEGRRTLNDNELLLAATVLVNVVDTYLRMGAWDKADVAAARGLQYLARGAAGTESPCAPDGREVAVRNHVRFLFSKAWLASQRGRCTEAITFAQEAMPIAEKMNDPDVTGALFNVLGIANIYGGNFPEAQKNLQQAISFREAAGNIQGLCDSLNNMSILKSYTGEIDGALKEQERILALRREMGDLWGEVLALSNIGVMHDESGDTRRALEFFLKSLEMRYISGMEHGLANSLLNVGSTRLKLGQFSEAFSCWDRALKTYEETGDIQGQINVLTNLAEFYRTMGAIDRAVLMAAKGLDMARAAGLKPEVSELLRIQAGIFQAQFRIDEALASTMRAFEMATDMGARTEAIRARLETARVYADSGSPEKAGAIAREIVLNRHNVSMTDIMAHGYTILARSTTGREALKSAEDAITLASESGLIDVLCEAQHELGRLLAQEGRARESAARFSAAFESLGSMLENVPAEFVSSFLAAPRWRRLLEDAALLPKGMVAVPANLADTAATARECAEVGQASRATTLGAPASGSAYAAPPSARYTAGPGIDALLAADLQSDEMDLPTAVSRMRTENGRLRTLLTVSQKMTSELNLAALLDFIVDSAIQMLNGESGFIILLDSKGGLNIHVARRYDRANVSSPELQISHSIAEEVATTGQAIVTSDARADARFSASDSVHDLAISSVICVPMRARDRTIGSLYVENRRVAAAFSEEDKELIQAFADQAAIAIENARLLQENRQKQEEVEESRRQVVVLNSQLRDLNRKLEIKLQDQSAELDAVRDLMRARLEDMSLKYTYDRIIAFSRGMRDVLRLLDKVTDSNFSVLIQGESGTGKELVANAIHFNGPRKSKPFAAENCAALSETLLESELFGYVRGAFTGAERDKKGLFEIADGGTLFLDEIANMSPNMQVKLLRTLETGELRRVGGKDTIKVDVRIISASNQNLKKLVGNGSFREDLFFRLNVFTVNLPPLRDRKEDVPYLVEHFLQEFASASGQPQKKLDASAIRLLVDYQWPGNVRELKNVINNVVSLVESNVLRAKDFVELLPTIDRRRERDALYENVSVEEYMRRFIIANREKLNNTEMAKALGISRKTLWDRRKKWSV